MTSHRSETDITNDLRDADRLATTVKVFSLHGRQHWLDPEECDALLMLAFQLQDPITRLMQDHGLLLDRRAARAEGGSS